MLSLGLTGGIAAGKSLLATRFRELGAVLIDADHLAREAVALDTPGLAAVAAHFGPEILLADGTLDRGQLGSLVFADPAARAALNAIVHPIVRAAAHALKRGAGPGSIVVQDIPLLVESGQGADFHLVVVVQAPVEERVARMLRDRGMSVADAMARIAAQASDAQRAAVADVLIVNDGDPQQTCTVLDELWHGRLLPFARNVAAQRPASLHLLPTAGPSDAAILRVAARIGRALRDVPEAQLLPVRGAAVPQFRVVMGTGGDGAGQGGEGAGQGGAVANTRADQLAPALATAGFFPLPHLTGGLGAYGDVLDISTDLPQACFASADPGCPALVVSCSVVVSAALEP